MKRSHYSIMTATVMFALGLVLAACKDSEPATNTPKGSAAPSTVALPESLFVAAAPQGAKPITELRASVKEGDEVTVRAVVGGRKSPFVDGQAIMTVVDAGLENTCTVEKDHCPTPWDYCCVAGKPLADNMASVRLLDAEGKVLKLSLSAADKIKPLSTLIIKGKVAPGSNAESLTIDAASIYIEPAASPKS